MIESFFVACKVAVPLVAFMGLGYLVRQLKMVSQSSVKEMNNVVFYVFLSTMVFYNIYQSESGKTFQGSLMGYSIISVLLLMLVSFFTVRRWIKDKRVAPVVIQGIYRSNFVLFGLQVSASLCPQKELGTVAILIAVIIPMYNLFAVLLFEIFREGKVQIGRVLVNIGKNPLIIGSLLGIAALFSGIRFGTVVDGTLADIAKLATPMSLVLLGATITLEGMVRQWKILTVVTLCRLVLVPGIFLGGAILLGFRHTDLVALMVMFAAPTAVSSFPMAITMGGDGELAGQIVASTTIFSVVSIFVWTYLLHYFAWI